MTDRTEVTKLLSSSEPAAGRLDAVLYVGTLTAGDTIHIQEELGDFVGLPSVNDVLFAVGQAGSSATITTLAGILAEGTKLTFGLNAIGTTSTGVTTTTDNKVYIVAQTI